MDEYHPVLALLLRLNWAGSRSDRFRVQGAQKGRKSSTSHDNLVGVDTVPSGGGVEGFFTAKK